MDTVVLFHSTNHAVWAEDELKNSGIKSKMIPVPRHLSSDCGYCLKIDSNNQEIAKKVLMKNCIEFAGIEELK